MMIRFFLGFILEIITAVYKYCFILNRLAFRFNNGTVRALIHYLGLTVSFFPMVRSGLSNDPEIKRKHRNNCLIQFFIFVFLEGLRLYKTSRLRVDLPYTLSVSDKKIIWPFTSEDLVIRFYSENFNNAFGPLRIALITDIHFSDHLSKGYYKNLVRQIKLLKPDLFLIGGDLIHKIDYIDGLKKFLNSFSDHDFRLGKFAILGNHDFAHGAKEIRKVLKETGFENIGGKNVLLNNRGVSFILKGNEAPWGKNAESCLNIKGANSRPLPVMCLSHTADNLHRFSEENIHLAMAGHYHDGQIKLPGFGPVLIPSVHGRLFSKGHFNINGTHVFISAGTGVSGPKFRIASRPEIISIDVK